MATARRACACTWLAAVTFGCGDGAIETDAATAPGDDTAVVSEVAASADTTDSTEGIVSTDTPAPADAVIATRQFGSCQATPDCAPFDDGNACNGVWVCDPGTQRCVVKAGSIVTCKLTGLAACQTAFCNPNSGQCEPTPLPDGNLCADGDPCTVESACQGGQCEALAGSWCQCQQDADCKDDGDACNGQPYCDKSAFPYACKVNPKSVVTCAAGSATACSKPTCDPKTGQCAPKPEPDGKLCDDGDLCTANDSCAAGKCQGKTATCVCQSDADCKDDGNLCNGIPFCHLGANPPVCKTNPASVVACASGQDTACLKNACLPSTGLCQLTPVEAAESVCSDAANCKWQVAKEAAKKGPACDDGDKCTAGDLCAAGKCVPGTDTCKCAADKDCEATDDGDKCNGIPFCNKATGKCQDNPASVVTCPSVGDTACSKLQCVPKSGQCEPKPVVDGSACDDGNLCTAGDHCEQGQCTAGANVCACKDDAGCAKFHDGDFCKGTMFCNKGKDPAVCELNPATKVVCKTANDTTCAKTVCVKASGACVAQPVADLTPCDDGNGCTAGDACFGGACKPGLTKCECELDGDCKKFEDGNFCNGTLGCNKETGKCELNPTTVVKCATQGNSACKQNLCDPANGKCEMKPVNQYLPCDADGLYCTLADSCLDGVCKPGANVCECLKDADCAAKDDGDPCNGVLYCDKSKALFACAVNPASVVLCLDDGLDACAVNKCSKASGKCAMAPKNEGGNCSDGDACTAGDKCKQGQCTPLKAVPCDDQNPCTDDSCDAVFGCVNTNSTKPCDDDDPCTVGDACKGGACQPGKKNACDDGKPCTDDACNPKTSECVLTPKSGPCDDGNKCTFGETCAADKCSGGKVIDCDDGNVCTDDACDPKLGCTHANNTAPCESKQCTAGDQCQGGACVAGKAGKLFTTELEIKSGAVTLALQPDGGVLAGGASFGPPVTPRLWQVDGTGKVTAKFVGTYADAVMRKLGVVAGKLRALYGAPKDGAYLSAVAGGGTTIEDTVQVGVSDSVNLKEAFDFAPLGGGFVVAGRAGAHSWLAKFDAKLSVVWHLDHSANDQPDALAGVATLPSGEIIAVGRGTELGLTAGSLDGLLLRVDGNTKAVLDYRAFGGVEYDEFNDVELVPGQGYVVVGASGSGGLGGLDGWVVRFDEANRFVWQKKLGTAGDDGFKAVAVAPDGGFVAAGWTFADNANSGWLVRFDAAGHLLWQQTLGKGAANGQGLNAVAVHPDGTLAAAGQFPAGAVALRTDPWGNLSCQQAGPCAGVAVADCDDGDPCTVDTCSPKQGCVHAPLTEGAFCALDKVCGADGKCILPPGMRLVPGGEFAMGCAKGETACKNDEKPLHKVKLPAYFVDATEVTVDQYSQCMKMGACTSPLLFTQHQSYNYGAPGRGSHPINGVSHAQASKYCQWRGKRLPTEAEWEKAARGGCEFAGTGDCLQAATIYPWGDGAPTCAYAHVPEGGKSGCGNGDTTTAVGSKPKGQSPYGVHDTVGNVWEWVADWYSATAYADGPTDDPQGPANGNNRVVRGGSFDAGAFINLPTTPESLRTSNRFSTAPSNMFAMLGFRCVRSVK